MKRIAAISLIAVLAACTPPASQDAETAADSSRGFPNLSQASYRLDAVASGDNGQEIPIVMIRDGTKTRMEFSGDEGRMVVVVNPEANDSFVVLSSGGQDIVMRSGAPPQSPDVGAQWSDQLGANATMTGPCSVAGETGSVWTNTTEQKTACVTSDGVLLQATEGERTVWNATSVQRGPQDAALFAPPPGAQVLDTSALSGALGKLQEQMGQ